jgi:transposase
MTDGKGIPIASGGIISGNHNDLYKVVPQYSKMINHLKECGISVVNSIQNADKGFDSKSLRRAIQRRNMTSNIIENARGRKNLKRGKKRYFNKNIYQERFVNERCFAWLDSFKTLLIRFDNLDKTWLNWHFLTFSLILLKV